jgi:hypothetical protein
MLSLGAPSQNPVGLYLFSNRVGLYLFCNNLSPNCSRQIRAQTTNDCFVNHSILSRFSYMISGVVAVGFYCAVG